MYDEVKVTCGSFIFTLIVDVFFHPIFPDDDECELGIHNCAINSQCMNTRGSFVCRCMPGFFANLEQCLGKLVLLSIM